MIYEPIINSLLDNDLYKLTMQNAVIKHFPRAIVRYEFFERTKNVEFPQGFAKELRAQIAHMSTLRLTMEEATWLREKCGQYLDPTYITYLKGYQYDPTQIGITQKGGELNLEGEGPWHESILWEVPLMALISELYFKMTGQTVKFDAKLDEKDAKKAATYAHMGIQYADFGTRRRYSYENHDRVVRINKNYGGKAFVGTSNVHFAMKYDLKPIGTHAHEWFMFMGAKYGYRQANREGLGKWVETYGGNLGIALSDTFTTEAFFNCFDTMYAKLFDGVRHDSGDPLEFADKVIEHYMKLGIDPMSKTIVFSDGLDPEEVRRITDYCRKKILFSFGIGTNTTNDVGVKALNMVIKMVAAMPYGYSHFINTIKLSDNPIKHLGPQDQIDLCKKDLMLSS